MAYYKLSNADVAGIRFARAEGASLGEIAKIYFISRTQVWRIIHRHQRTADSSLRSQSGGKTVRVNVSVPPPSRPNGDEFLDLLQKL